jgi:putative Ca2+/H+ antiporter (TMEM165/GDT1 family)
LTQEEVAKAYRVNRSAFLAVPAASFLADLGDKTMLVAVTLATKALVRDLDRLNCWHPRD